MTSNSAILQKPTITNGIDVEQVTGVVGRIEADAEAGQFQFRLRNKWVAGGLTRSLIQGFSAGGEEDRTRTQPFIVCSDEPEIMAGEDSAPNAVEYMLHALASCLTTSLVYHTAVSGIELEAVEAELTGDIDARGLLGISEEVPKGFKSAVVNLRVRGEASAEEFKAMALFSPVYEMVSAGLPVDLQVEKF